MKKSKTTIRYIKLHRLFRALSIITGFMPVIIYFMTAFVRGDTITKVTLISLFTIVIILTVVNTLMKYKLRTPVFVFLIGVYIGLKNILGVLILIAVCTALDELLLAPMANRYKSLATINKELDKR